MNEEMLHLITHSQHVSTGKYACCDLRLSYSRKSLESAQHSQGKGQQRTVRSISQLEHIGADDGKQLDYCDECPALDSEPAEKAQVRHDTGPDGEDERPKLTPKCLVIELFT